MRLRRRLVLTRDATADLAGVRGWLLQTGSGVNARARLADIRAAIRRLPNFPEAGSISPLAEDLRVIVVARHRIFYLVTDTMVRVIRILGPGQDAPEI